MCGRAAGRSGVRGAAADARPRATCLVLSRGPNVIVASAAAFRSSAAASRGSTAAKRGGAAASRGSAAAAARQRRTAARKLRTAGKAVVMSGDRKDVLSGYLSNAHRRCRVALTPPSPSELIAPAKDAEKKIGNDDDERMRIERKVRWRARRRSLSWSDARVILRCDSQRYHARHSVSHLATR